MSYGQKKCTKSLRNNQRNIFQEFQIISSYLKFDQNEKHFRGKCAEVYLENGKYFINCYFCEKHLQNMENLMGHIYDQHLKLVLPSNWDQQDEDILNNKVDNNVKTAITTIEPNNNTILSNENYNDLTDLIDSVENKIFDEESGNKMNKTSNQNNNFEVINSSLNYMNQNSLYSCNICTQSFTKLIKLEEHLIEHTELKNSYSPINSYNVDDEYCDIGSNSNSRNDALMKIKNERKEDGKFHCHICNRKYNRYKYLCKHYAQEHTTNSNILQCPDCPLKFKAQYRLNVHRRTHTGEKPYKCPHCPKGFALKTNLKRHIHIHLNEKPFSCTYCDMKFRQQSSQKSHERNIHTKERPHQCEQCGKSFPRLALLKEHWKRHTNNRPFQCHICFRSFFDNAGLKLHLNLHTGEKIYKCNLCPKIFKAPNTLKSHLKLHLDTKQYQCKLCDKTFAQISGLYGHMKIYHKTITKDDFNMKLDDSE